MFEEMLFGLGLFITVLFVTPFLYAKMKKKDSHLTHVAEMPASLLFLILAFFLSILVVIYSQRTPYSPLGVVVSVILSTVGVGFFSVLLYPFRYLSIFVEKRKLTTMRIGILVFLYAAYFYLVNIGFSFLFNGIVGLKAIALTPEFARYAVPTLSALVLAIYRLSRVFSFKMTEFLEEISKDVMIVSLLMFWLRIAVSGIGLTVSSDLSSELWTMSPLTAVVVGATLVSLEWLLLRLRKDLMKMRPAVSMEQQMQSLFLTLISEGAKQKTLEEFGEKKMETKPPRRPNRAIQTLDKRFSVRYRGHFLRPSRVLRIALLLLLLLLTGSTIALSVMKRETIVLATGFVVKIDLRTAAQLPENVKFIVSESMDSLQTEEFYAIPIVSVETQNASFEAPLSNRFISLNSSQFQVLTTENYLLLSLTRAVVETHVYVLWYKNVEYDQTGNSVFDYKGFFREAEILYCLGKFGYANVTTLSTTNLGEITSISKIIYAGNETGCSAMVTISWRSDIVVSEDVTCFVSQNKDFIEDAIFLIQQTKSGTRCTEDISNFTAPFRIVVNQ